MERAGEGSVDWDEGRKRGLGRKGGAEGSFW